MIRLQYRRLLVVTLLGGAACALCDTVVAAETAAPLKIVARKRLQGPSQSGVPAEYRVIRSFTELVRAVGIDRATAVHEEWGKPKLDFERYMFVYVSAGSRRSSGYAVNIVDVVRHDREGRPEVAVRWSLYEPQGYVLWVITTPAELVMVERAEGESTFERVPFADTPAAGGNDEPPAAAAAKNSGKSPPSAANWDALVREYDELGLPRPPADARPAVKFYEMELVEERDLVVPLHAPRYLAGFVTTAGEKKRMFVGTETLNLSTDDVDLTEFGADRVLPGVIVDAYGWGSFEIDVALPTAVECYRRGLTEFAEQLLRIRTSRSIEHPLSVFHQPAGVRLEVALRHVAWTHWGNQLTTGGTDRKAIHRRMAALVESEPSLQTPRRRAFVQALAAALEPSDAPPESSERLVDELVEVDALYFGRQGAVGPPWPIDKLTTRGWDALPTLMAHLDDRRLTRSIVRTWDGSATYVPQVGELVSNLIQELAGDEGRDWKRTPDEHFLPAEPVGDWWRRAQAAGEEKYLVDHVIPRAPHGTKHYDAMVALLKSKYPDRLREVYRRSLAERPDLDTWRLVSEIVATADAGAAADVLAQGAAHPRIARQTEALEALAEVAPTRFETCLTASFARMPATAPGRYADAEQAGLARLGPKSGSADVGAALRQATVRADVGVRMEILDALGRMSPSSYDERKRLIDFLAAFLGDMTVRDTAIDPQKYDGCAGARWPKLEVRNWAAYRAAELLGIELSKFQSGMPVTDDAWAALRKAVAAEREKP